MQGVPRLRYAAAEKRFGDLMRILIAAFAAAVAMFAWSAIAHMATPLASTGVSQMQDEKVVLGAMKQGIGEKPGLYIFPWVDPKDPQMMEKMKARMKIDPDGILIYHPVGSISTDMGPLMIKEFVKELAQSLIAAFLLSLTVLTGYAARAGFVVLIGVFAALGQDASYWIWYAFPLDYTLAQIAMALGQAVAAGLVIAAILKPKPA